MWLSPESCQVRVSINSLFIQWGVGGGGGWRGEGCPPRVRTGHISMDGGHQGCLSCLGIVSTMCSTTRVWHTDRSQTLNHSPRSTQFLPTHPSASGYTGSRLPVRYDCISELLVTACVATPYNQHPCCVYLKKLIT